MSETGFGKTPFSSRMPARDDVSPASPPFVGGFARNRSRPRPLALLFALLVSGGLFGLMLFVSVGNERASPFQETPVLFSAKHFPAQDSAKPEEEPVQQEEVFADSPEEAAPASRPRTLAPAPSLPVMPPPAIDLVTLERPQVQISGEGLNTIIAEKSEGNDRLGSPGRGGKGGDGIAGDGSGGAGEGKGSGSQLIASWAPQMDFSLNYRYYPPRARREGVEGVVLLECFVLRRDRVRDCTLVGEKPAGYGFGKAALRTERGMRVRVHNQAGRRIYDEWVMIKTFFHLPE